MLWRQARLHKDGRLVEPLPPAPADGVTGICYLFCVAAGAEHSWKNFYVSKRVAHGSSVHDKMYDAVETSVQARVGIASCRSIAFESVPTAHLGYRSRGGSDWSPHRITPQDVGTNWILPCGVMRCADQSDPPLRYNAMCGPIGSSPAV